MREFLDEDFLLSTEAARHLYHDYAEGMPIYDYHCHLSPEEIARNKKFPNIGELLLGGDHYKWRALSAYGEDNGFVRTASDEERFFAYAKAMPMMMGNPLYHWTHLELRRVFGIAEPLSEKNARAVWDACNELLQREDFRARGLIQKFDVQLICTTDDPLDDLRWHSEIARDKSFGTKVLPAFRPDKALHAERPDFARYLLDLGEVTGMSIGSMDDVLAALESRVEYFHQNGARISDHGLDRLPRGEGNWKNAQKTLTRALSGESLTPVELDEYRFVLLCELGKMYARRGWVQQYHINALRNANSAAFARFGADTGFDAVRDAPVAEPLSRLLDAQEQSGELPKTILYTLNPADYYPLVSVAGCFQGGTPGKIQLGSGWWFCDQLYGMEQQLRTLASVGLLPQFVGMLTDSRSFVSYTRHEYFRRLLCNILGAWVENGEYPRDETTLEKIVRGICYDNAKEYFGIAL